MNRPAHPYRHLTGAALDAHLRQAHHWSAGMVAQRGAVVSAGDPIMARYAERYHRNEHQETDRGQKN